MIMEEYKGGGEKEGVKMSDRKSSILGRKAWAHKCRFSMAYSHLVGSQPDSYQTT
jgi:hypothetical protein